MESLSELFRRRTKELGVTQAELAKKIDINPSIISRISTGKIARPSDETLARLSGQLSCSLEELQRSCAETFSKEQSEPRVLVRESIWAMCIILERIIGEPIETILQNRLKEALYKNSEKEEV